MTAGALVTVVDACVVAMVALDRVGVAVVFAAAAGVAVAFVVAIGSADAVDVSVAVAVEAVEGASVGVSIEVVNGVIADPLAVVAAVASAVVVVDGQGVTFVAILQSGSLLQGSDPS